MDALGWSVLEEYLIPNRAMPSASTRHRCLHWGPSFNLCVQDLVWKQVWRACCWTEVLQAAAVYTEVISWCTEQALPSLQPEPGRLVWISELASVWPNGTLCPLIQLGSLCSRQPFTCVPLPELSLTSCFTLISGDQEDWCFLWDHCSSGSSPSTG